MEKEKTEQLSLDQVKITGGFWKHYQDLVSRVTSKSVYEQFEKSGRFRALTCSWKEGQPDQPHIFWDSDTAKWIEAASYLIEIGRDEDGQLREKAEALIRDIIRSQREDGYFNSYYLTCEPEGIFSTRWNHELYCAGHLIEAAIAWDKATDEHAFLEAMKRFADMIEKVFVKEKSAAFITPGHEELELALLKLADYAGESRYRDLALFFLNERGANKEQGAHPAVSGDDPDYMTNPLGAEFSQSDTPVREIREAKGHSVRACYLYTAMADAALKTNDQELLMACRNVYEDITQHKLSITGGIGAWPHTEGFSFAWDLPNERNYNETCAAISLAMFAEKLADSEENSAYADLIERILYNGMLSGMSLAGDAFFYENALELDLRTYEASRGLKPPHAENRGLMNDRRITRAKVFSCSCCPPNILRTIASVGRFLYRQKEGTLYCEQFASSEAEFLVEDGSGKPQKGRLTQETDYPVSGKVRFHWEGPEAKLAVRVPDWCVEFSETCVSESSADAENGKDAERAERAERAEGSAKSMILRNGYAIFPVQDGSSVEIDLPMMVHFLEADPAVRQDCGRIAVQRGPVVYCMESIDNGNHLRDIELIGRPQAVRQDGFTGQMQAEIEPQTEIPAPVLRMKAQRRVWNGGLYRIAGSKKEQFTARLIPYFAFANRGESNMLVWTRQG